MTFKQVVLSRAEHGWRAKLHMCHTQEQSLFSCSHCSFCTWFPKSRQWMEHFQHGGSSYLEIELCYVHREIKKKETHRPMALCPWLILQKLQQLVSDRRIKMLVRERLPAYKCITQNPEIWP